MQTESMRQAARLLQAERSHSSSSLQSLGEMEVLVGYEYQRAEAPNYNVESRGVGPGCPAAVYVTGVTISGNEVEASSFSADQLRRWEEAIMEEIDSEREMAADCAAEARYQMARDDAMERDE